MILPVMLVSAAGPLELVRVDLIFAVSRQYP